MTRSSVIAGLITKFDGVINGTDTSAIELAVFKLAICQLVDAAFSGGGGGGGGSTTPQIVSDGIDQSIDINTIIARLADLVAKPNPPSQSDITIAINAAVDIDTIITRLTSLDTSKLTQANIESAIQSAADIDTIITRLTTIATNTDGGGGAVSTPITAYTQSTTTTTDAGIVVLALNANRKGAVIVNRSTTNPVDLFFGALGAYGVGLPLAPGQPYEINSTNLYTGVIRSITSTGITAVLAVAEGT